MLGEWLYGGTNYLTSMLIWPRDGFVVFLCYLTQKPRDNSMGMTVEGVYVPDH